MRHRLVLTALVVLLGAPTESVLAHALPSARELAESVVARYASMQTYYDTGVARVDLAGKLWYQQRFETFFTRQHGLKMVMVEPNIQSVMWNDLRCTRVYQPGRPEFLVDECRPPEQASMVGAIHLPQILVPRALLARLDHPVLSRASRIEEQQMLDGRIRYALIEGDLAPPEMRTTWIDAASRLIVGFEQRTIFADRPPTEPKTKWVITTTVDYRVIEIDGPMAATAVQFRPPSAVHFDVEIGDVLVYAAFLGLPAAVMLLLGRRYGRRDETRGRPIAVRAGLWSLVLSWSLFEAVGPGALVVPLPAWLLLGVRIVPGLAPDDAVIPAAWLSVAGPLCAYVVGALWSRAQSGPITP